MWRLWCVLVVVGLEVRPSRAVVGGEPAAAPEPDSAVVFVQKHGFSARLEGIKNEKLGYYTFMGIRYAEPPVGPRRFQRPIRRLLAGELLLNRNCLPCPQPDPRVRGRFIGHEDCLCLNVYSPKMPGDEQGCPVVLFIHGGNYRSGSASSYGGQHLTQKDTILVTPQYRLGSLGYLSTGMKDASGNVGLFDLRAAMTWINDYISFFGGDPTRVVIMGQGSGGSAASLMALSPETRSATTGVAALSGAPLSPGAVRPDPALHSRTLAEKTDCPSEPAERLILCLRKLPAEKIIEADQHMEMEMVDTERFINEISGINGAGARVEGEDDARGLPPIIVDQPNDSLKKREKRSPMLTGVNSAETSNAIFGKYEKFLTNKLAKTKDFIKNDLIGGLRGVVSGVEGLLPGPAGELLSVLPVNDYYQKVFDTAVNILDGLEKVAEATGDALFNFPAYQSVKAWSAGGPAYLYSFEYKGNLTKGSHFLPGLALTDRSNISPDGKKHIKGPSHGDELAYLFEPLDDDGNSVAGDISSSDAKVRDSFVDLIAKFAHNLTPMESQNKSAGLLGSFSDNNDQFLKIDHEIKVEKDFKFCEMGLWGNMADRLTGALCKNLLGNLLNLSPVPIGSVTNDLTKNSLPLVNVLGGGSSQGNKRQQPTTKKPMLPNAPIRLPFGF